MFFRNNYFNGVKKHAEKLLFEHLNPADANEAMVMLVVYNRMQQDAGLINLKEISKGYRKLGLTFDEAALALIDGTVTQMKLALSVGKPDKELEQSLTRVVGLLEIVIDKEFSRRPIRFLPRNGETARRAEESGLDKFVKDTSPPA
jgi:hypothetical protein